MTRKKIFCTSIFISILLLILTDRSTHFIHHGKLYFLESSFLEPLFFVSIFTFISSSLLFFFSEKVFKLWLIKLMIWFAPLSLIIIATGSVEVSYSWPTRTSLAIGLGGIMVAVTFIFALVQRFYYGIK